MAVSFFVCLFEGLIWGVLWLILGFGGTLGGTLGGTKLAFEKRNVLSGGTLGGTFRRVEICVFEGIIHKKGGQKGVFCTKIGG